MNVDAVTFQIFQTLKKGLLHPINEFMDDSCIVDVCEKFKFHNYFFPIPLFITAKSEDLKNPAPETKGGVYWQGGGLLESIPLIRRSY